MAKKFELRYNSKGEQVFCSTHHTGEKRLKQNKPKNSTPYKRAPKPSVRDWFDEEE